MLKLGAMSSLDCRIRLVRTWHWGCTSAWGHEGYLAHHHPYDLGEQIMGILAFWGLASEALSWMQNGKRGLLEGRRRCGDGEGQKPTLKLKTLSGVGYWRAGRAHTYWRAGSSLHRPVP